MESRPSGCWGRAVWMILDVDRAHHSVSVLVRDDQPVHCWPGRPTCWPDQVSVGLLAAVVGGTMVLSALLVAYAVLRVRAETRGGSSRRFARLSSWLGKSAHDCFAWRPGPSLDRDPVLWREWRRGRPSRLARIVWGVYIVLALAGTGWGIFDGRQCRPGSPGEHQFLGLVGGLEATFGLLLLSHGRSDRSGRGAGARQPRRPDDHADFHRPDRPGQVVGRVSGRAGPGSPARHRRDLERGDRPDSCVSPGTGRLSPLLRSRPSIDWRWLVCPC